MFQEYTVFPTAPQPNIEERHGYPRQYSCLENLWTEEPVGYRPQGHKEWDTTEATEHSTAVRL